MKTRLGGVNVWLADMMHARDRVTDFPMTAPPVVSDLQSLHPRVHSRSNGRSEASGSNTKLASTSNNPTDQHE